MTGYPPPPSSYPPPSPYPPPTVPSPAGTPYLPGAGFGAFYTRPTDVMGRRIGAYAIDLAIAFIIFIIMVLALATSRGFDTTREATAFCDGFNNNPDVICTTSGTTALVLDSTELGAIVLAEAGFAFVNFVLLTGLTGFSFGKALTGIRVVTRQSGQRCGLARALLRTILLAIPDLFGVVGVIVAAKSSDHRRVGDIAAGTVVVHKRALGHPPSQPLYAPGLYAPGGYPIAPPPPGYSYQAPQPSWPPVPTAPSTAPPPTWHVPPPPTPTVATSWPDFGTAPTNDPDATSVFDTTSTTDSNVVVGESTTVPATAKAEPSAPPTPSAAAPTPAAAHATSPVATPGGEGAEPMPGVGAPHWDVKRNTYIQWDPELKAWMQWDNAKSEWHAMK